VARLGFAALVLALVGLYGIVAYTVAQRKTEIAIRIALGSPYIRVIKMIVGSGRVTRISPSLALKSE
jgi:ABC-type antimicrobial peptide transport system permease subunit